MIPLFGAISDNWNERACATLCKSIFLYMYAFVYVYVFVRPCVFIMPRVCVKHLLVWQSGSSTLGKQFMHLNPD